MFPVILGSYALKIWGIACEPKDIDILVDDRKSFVSRIDEGSCIDNKRVDFWMKQRKVAK